MTSNNFWVSPEGKEHPVANHTSWLEQMFKTKLPPFETPEHEIEKNKLYDWAFRLNWIRALVDPSKQALYVDPDPLTGAQWRWLARRGAQGHLLLLNTDGKELGNFQPGKRKKRSQMECRVCLGLGAKTYVAEVAEVKDFIMGQPPRFTVFQYGDMWGVGVPRNLLPGMREKGHLNWARTIGYLRKNSTGTWSIRYWAAPFEPKKASDLFAKQFATQQEAAEALWNACMPEVQSEARPRSVKRWITTLPGAKEELDWQVLSRGNDGEQWEAIGGFKDLYHAHRYSMGWSKAYPYSRDHLQQRIRQIHVPTGKVLWQYQVTPVDNGLRPMDVNEAVDIKRFILRAKMRYRIRKNYRPAQGGRDAVLYLHLKHSPRYGQVQVWVEKPERATLFKDLEEATYKAKGTGGTVEPVYDEKATA